MPGGRQAVWRGARRGSRRQRGPSSTARLSSGDDENNGEGTDRPTDVLSHYLNRRRLGAYLDGALDEGTARSTAAHLATCGVCQRKAAELRRLKGLLQETLA